MPVKPTSTSTATSQTPGDVTVLLEWETIDRARRFLDHDKSKEFLQEGAVGPVQIRYLAEAVSLRRTAAD